MAIRGSRLSNSKSCLSKKSDSAARDAKSISADHSLINRGRADPVVSPLQTETFHELNFDACGQRSNSSFSASFVVEALSSVTDRVSDTAVEVDGICSHGLCSAGHNGWNQLFLAA